MSESAVPQDIVRGMSDEALENVAATIRDTLRDLRSLRKLLNPSAAPTKQKDESSGKVSHDEHVNVLLTAARAKFMEFDTDKTGEIDGDEALGLVEWIFQTTTKLSDKECHEYAEKYGPAKIREIDTDQDGKVSMVEFRRLFTSMARQHPELLEGECEAPKVDSSSAAAASKTEESAATKAPEEEEEDDDDEEDDDEDGDGDLDHQADVHNVDPEKNKGLLSSSMIKAKGTMKGNRALVFDCGTGETKAILLEYDASRTGAKVSVKEAAKAPAVLDFLTGQSIFDNKDYMKKLHKCRDKGDLSKVAKLEANPFFFLKKPPRTPSDAEGTLVSDHFVQFCEEQHSLNDANTTMIGSSAWHRAAQTDYNRGAEAEALVTRLTESGLLCKKLEHLQEAYFEATAVAYAAFQLKVPKVDAVMGSGGGSVQFMHSMEVPFGLNCGHRMGIEAVLSTYKKTKDIKQALAQVDIYCHRTDCTVDGLQGRVQAEVNRERARKVQKYPDNPAMAQKIKGTVIAISACYYAAVEVGIDNGDHLMIGHVCRDVKKKFAAKALELRQLVEADPTLLKRQAMAIVNLHLQLVLLDNLIDDDTTIIFKRNWQLGSTPFRTTWTAGWYLYLLEGLGVSSGGSKVVLANYKKIEMAAKAQLAKEMGRLGNLSEKKQENVAMMLVDLKDVVKGIRALGAAVGDKIDPIMIKKAAEFGGKLIGFPKYRIKGPDSLYRKLICEITGLLEKHQSDPGYTPDLEDCVRSIHDALRYTVQFPLERYTEGVKAFEKEFLQQGGVARKIKFKNFWQEKDLVTTYMGINSQVELNSFADIPNSSGYIFELQFHTPQSFHMKDGPGHHMYEAFRDPACKKGLINGKELEGDMYKVALYNGMKRLWCYSDQTGTPFTDGDVVAAHIKDIDLDTHAQTEVYKFKAYKPLQDICSYTGSFGKKSQWISKTQSSKKMDKKERAMQKKNAKK